MICKFRALHSCRKVDDCCMKSLKFSLENKDSNLKMLLPTGTLQMNYKWLFLYILKDLFTRMSFSCQFLVLQVKIIGVEPADANAMALSLHHGKRIVLDQVGGFADGVAVKMVGEETFRLSRNLIDGVVLVSRDSICAAIKVIFYVSF